MLKIIINRLEYIIQRLLVKFYPNAFASYIVKNKKLYESIRIWGGDLLYSLIDENIEYYLTDLERNDTKLIELLKKDIVKCHYKYGINPIEYFIHDFRAKSENIRDTYMPKMLKDKIIMSQLGDNCNKAFYELKDKIKFYNLTRKYFKRDVCSIKSKKDFLVFENFTQKHPCFIAKPIKGRFGQNTNIYDLKDSEYSAKFVFDKLIKITDEWIIEELIIQDERMAEWNSSSVNSIRIPSFRTSRGIVVFAPFMRIGRDGSPVDNAGAGGVMFSIHSKTGQVCSDAMDELGHTFKEHPDSLKIFKEWCVPHWNELIRLSNEVHMSLPEYHKYVGFDFALSKDKGWVLVEGNWGDFICQQATLHKGLKNEFIELMKS